MPMYKVFEEYFISETELKEKILQSLEYLTTSSPEEYKEELLLNIDTEKNSQDIILYLIDKIPSIKKLAEGFHLLSSDQWLGEVAVQLDVLAFAKNLEFVLPKVAQLASWKQFLGIEYCLAIEVIERKLNQELRYDPDKILPILMNPFDPSQDAVDKFLIPKFAREEIERVLSDESEGNNFRKVIVDFENFIEDYIKKNLANLVMETFARVFLESILVKASTIDEYLDSEKPLNNIERKEFVKSLLQIVRSNTSSRIGIRRGGNRKKAENKEFSWTDENKIAFYETVENLPKDRGKTFWQMALKWLIIEADFSSPTIVFLKAKPIYEGVPPYLFDEALKKWRNYADVASINEIPAEIKPQAFEFRHALDILNFPDENKFSTLRTYYFDGQKLVKK